MGGIVAEQLKDALPRKGQSFERWSVTVERARCRIHRRWPILISMSRLVPPTRSAHPRMKGAAHRG